VTGIGLVALDLVVFFLVYRPLGARLEATARRHEELRKAIRNQQMRVDLLKQYEAAMPAAGEALENFMGTRAPSRREAYSTAAHLLHKVAETAGVKVSTLAYHAIDKELNDPLERLSLEINVQGPYAGLLKFSHGLETANEFILIRDCTIAPGDNGALSLRLGADLYVTP
jgi:Tfp pilus assembly protein PilO